MMELRDGFWSIHQAKRGDVKKELKDEHDDQNKPYKTYGCNRH